MGNLRSVQKALEQVGANATITSDAQQIANANKVILPGVGAFGDAISELRSRDLTSAVLDVIDAGKPFLGICLGLQMLFESSEEGSGDESGLALLAGSVKRFPVDLGLKVPHMGWNQVTELRTDCPLLRGIPSDAFFYFVHSYYVSPRSDDAVWLECEYGTKFCAAVWKDNLFATQFHPEKSQQHGLTLLKNFAAL